MPALTEGLGSLSSNSASGCDAASAADCTDVQVANSGFWWVIDVEGAVPGKCNLKLDSALLPSVSLSRSVASAGASSKGCTVFMGLYRAVKLWDSAVKLWDSSCAYVPLVTPTKSSYSRPESFCRSADLCSSFSTASCT